MRNIIVAVIITAGLTIPFSFMAGTLVFGHRIKAIETAEKSVDLRPLPTQAHFEKITANCIQLVDDKGRSRIELFEGGNGYAAINFVDYVKYEDADSYMNKMRFYSHGTGDLAGIEIDGPLERDLHDFDLTCDILGPRIEMNKNDSMFNLKIEPDSIQSTAQNLLRLEITPFETTRKQLKSN